MSMKRLFCSLAKLPTSQFSVIGVCWLFKGRDCLVGELKKIYVDVFLFLHLCPVPHKARQVSNEQQNLACTHLFSLSSYCCSEQDDWLGGYFYLLVWFGFCFLLSHHELQSYSWYLFFEGLLFGNREIFSVDGIHFFIYMYVYIYKCITSTEKYI